MPKIIAAISVLLLAALNAGKAVASQPAERIVVANSSTWVPYSFLDKERQARGILIDLWRLYADKNEYRMNQTHLRHNHNLPHRRR